MANKSWGGPQTIGSLVETVLIASTATFSNMLPASIQNLAVTVRNYLKGVEAESELGIYEFSDLLIKLL